MCADRGNTNTDDRGQTSRSVANPGGEDPKSSGRHAEACRWNAKPLTWRNDSWGGHSEPEAWSDNARSGNANPTARGDDSRRRNAKSLARGDDSGGGHPEPGANAESGGYSLAGGLTDPTFLIKEV